MPDSATYKGAVVEYTVNRDGAANLENYVNFIANASSQDVDIIVFPEMTLSAGIVEVPIYGDLKQFPVPAEYPEMYNNILVKLSDAAKKGQIYVIVNLQEVMNCSAAADAEDCPDNKTYRFNTNVVFDRNGAVISRYRKINLFGEFSRSPALKPDLGIFDSDFGVRFGHFICFDLLFQIPANQIVQYGIQNILFPTMWFSELPYLTAVQIQEAYAIAENVNFLAAGANNVAVGSAGSGIYSGSAGALISVMPATPTTRMLIADIPKVPGQITSEYPGHQKDDPGTINNLAMKRDLSLSAHKTKLLEAGNHEFTLEDGEMTCNFKVNFKYSSTDKVYVYRAGVLDGVRDYDGVATGGVRVCSVFACVNNTMEGCGIRYNSYEKSITAVFEELQITAVTSSPKTVNNEAKDAAYFLVSSDVTMNPLKAKDYSFTVESSDKRKYSFTLVNSDVELLSFAVWGRIFGRDGDEPTPEYDSAMIHGINSFLLFISIIFVIFKQFI